MSYKTLAGIALKREEGRTLFDQKQQCRLFLENIKGRNLENVEELLLTRVSSTAQHCQCCCTDLVLILLQPLDGSLAGETETDKEFKPKFGRRSKVRFQEEMVGETQM